MFLQEVAEPLQDLKEGMDQLEKNKTLRYILTTLLAIGNFLNSTDVSDSGHVNDSAPLPSPPHPTPPHPSRCLLLAPFPPTLLPPLPCQHIYLARITVGPLCVQECARLTAPYCPSTVKAFVVVSV